MLIDGPIEAGDALSRSPRASSRLRRCSSTAPLKQEIASPLGQVLPATPSMLIDGPIEARCHRRPSSLGSYDSVDAHRRPH